MGKSILSQKSLNKVIKSWLESEGFRVIITGGKHQFVIQVADLFPIKNYQIPDVVGISDSSVVVVETETKLKEIYEAIVKCLVWKTMATWVYLALPSEICTEIKILRKYGIGLLRVSDHEVKEMVKLPKRESEMLSIVELYPLDLQRQQELFMQIGRSLE